jgi:hypothetical protein
MQVCVLSTGKLDLIGWELGEDSVEVGELLAVDRAELDWRHGLFDVIEHIAVHDEAWQVVAEDDRVSALKAL